MSLLDRLLIAVVLISALWWACSRHRRPAALQRLSAVAPALAAATVIFDDGPRWQMVPWQALAVGVALPPAYVSGARAFAPGVACGRPWRARTRRGHRRRDAVDGVRAAAARALRFTPSRQPDLPLDRRLASRDADARPGRSPTGHRPGLVPDRHRPRPPGPLLRGSAPASGLGRRAAVVHVRRLRRDRHPRDVRGADQQGARAWPVLVFSPGLGVPREQYTSLCTELASRGFAVIALSAPYESAPTVLAGGRVVGQTVHPDVMGPPPHPELQRLIDIRAADASFVLDRLAALATDDRRSPLAGHLDLRHVGIVGHSLGGATAVQVMAADPRFKVGVNLDGKLFGTQPDGVCASRCCGCSPTTPDARVHAGPRSLARRPARRWRRAHRRRQRAHVLQRRAVLLDGRRPPPARRRRRRRLRRARRHVGDDRRRDRRVRRPRSRDLLCPDHAGRPRPARVLRDERLVAATGSDAGPVPMPRYLLHHEPSAARVRSRLRLLHGPREPAAPRAGDRLVPVRRPRHLVGRPRRSEQAALALLPSTWPRAPPSSSSPRSESHDRPLPHQ